MAETLTPPAMVMPKQEQPADANPTPNAANIAPPLPIPVIPVRYDTPTQATAPVPMEPAPEPDPYPKPTATLRWNGAILEQEWLVLDVGPPPTGPAGQPTPIEVLKEWRVIPPKAP